jgi:hypothetical protein
MTRGLEAQSARDQKRSIRIMRLALEVAPQAFWILKIFS